jgi:transposase
MMAAMLDPASSPDPREDVAALKAQVAALTARLDVATRAVAARDRVIETLKDQLAALRRRSFGQSSEKLGRAADQLELQIEDLEQETAAAEDPVGTATHDAPARRQPVRAPLPDHLPREVEELPGPYAACPGCGETLRRIGEDVSEVLELVPARLRVRRFVRPVMACRCCGDVSQAPPPPVPLAPKPAHGEQRRCRPARRHRGGQVRRPPARLPAGGTLRPRELALAKAGGVPIARSTLTDWLGRTAALLAPLAERIGTHVMAAAKLHADDTPVPVLAPGAGKTRTGRLWVYVRDDRASADASPNGRCAPSRSAARTGCSPARTAAARRPRCSTR